MIKNTLLIGITLVVIGIVGGYISYQFTDTASKAVNITEKIQNKDIETIDINSDIADIYVFSVNNTDEARVELTGYSKQSDVLSISQENSSLSIKTMSHNNDKWFNLNLNLNKPDKFDLSIYLPNKKYSQIMINGSLGTIQLKELQAKQMKVSTDVGNINLKNSNIEKLSAYSSLGEILIRQTKGNLDLSTDVGNIRVESQENNKKIIGKTNLGNINILFEDEPKNFKVNAITSLGDTNIFDKYDSQVSMGSEDIELDLKTELGDISVITR